ncbi:MAG TPA: endopeptidase La [Armatimonadota bacterium]|jgi:ATP-dependent Lon protease
MDEVIEQTLGGTEENESMELPEILNLLPLRDTVLFPAAVLPLNVARESSVKMIDDTVTAGGRIIATCTMKDSSIDKPGADDIYTIGTAVVIRMMLKMPDGVRLMVQGLGRFRIVEVLQTDPYIRVRIEPLSDQTEVTEEQAEHLEALRRAVGDVFKRVVELAPGLPDELAGISDAVTEPAVLADMIAAHLPIGTEEKQGLLETLPVRERMERLLSILNRESQVLELSSKIQGEVREELNKTQRDYFLREQMKAIQRELGDADDRTEEIEELRQKIEASGMTEEAHKEADRELDRLQRMPPQAAEYTVSRTYLDWLTSLPWQSATIDNLDIPHVKEVLDTDHFGLDKVKDRLLEFLSVRKFKPEGHVRQPILCFVGPPGVGKTSLAKSIARALGRKFVRFSLGGMRDEAEIRGHRRTYVGALPGQIIQGIRRAESNNAVMVLDEVDKLGSDFRGDPTSALLEVLDPEQNNTFRDHYLDVSFDLSKVLFITTANMLDPIPGPLRDRMEIIEIAGYTEEEKVQIAIRHLIPKQMYEHGLKSAGGVVTEEYIPEGERDTPKDVPIDKEVAPNEAEEPSTPQAPPEAPQGHIAWTEEGIRDILRGYTREAGVRNLERQVAAVCRKCTRQFAEGRTEPVTVDVAAVESYLGAPRFEDEDLRDRTLIPGVVTGLAWTPVGGDVLFVEAIAMPGERGLTLTGQLGDVMKESAQAALSWVRAHSRELGIADDFFTKHELHVHVPQGAVPKDGPSAGVTMATAITSLATGRPTIPLLAMTGEISLSGRVLPIGGLKEKALAAHRAGVRTLIVPERNRKDFEEDVPEDVRAELTVHYVKELKEVLDLALQPAKPGTTPPNDEPIAV